MSITYSEDTASGGDASWIGSSYIVGGGTWYNGSGGGQAAGAWNGHDFGYVGESWTLGGEVKTDESDGASHPAWLGWEVKTAGGEAVSGKSGSITMQWFKWAWDDQSSPAQNRNWFHSSSGSGANCAFASETIDLSGLTAGTEYKLHVWFYANSPASVWDSNGGGNYVATFRTKPAAPTVNITGSTVNSISGTVTCESGGTVTLKRYATSEAAGSDTGGTTVLNAVEASGTSVSFTDSGLGSCTKYYYRAWQSKNGQTSEGTATAAEGTTSDVSAPSPTGGASSIAAAGNGTATFTWGSVAGADHYLLSVWTAGGGYSRVTSTPSSWEGDYVIVGNNDTTYAMNNTVGSYAGRTAVTVNDGVISTTDSTIIWTVAGNDTDGYTIKNGDYFLNPATAKSVGWSTTANGSWDFAVDASGVATIRNHSSTGWYLQYNSGSSRFCCYQNTMVNLRLFKKSGSYVIGGAGGTAVTVGEEIHDLEVTSPVTVAGLTVTPTPVTYNWSVTAVGAGGCTAATTGTVTPTAATPTLTVSDSTVAVPGATYPSAGSSTSFTVSGVDLTGNVSAAVTGDTSAFEWKVGSGSWGSSITLPSVSGGSLTLTTISVRLKAEATGGNKSATVTFSGGGLTSDVTVSVSGTVTAVLPTVGSPTRTSLTTTGATLGGTVTANGGATLTEWGVVYSATSKNTTPTVGGTGCTNLTASGTPSLAAFTRAVSGLSPNTEYKWRAYARNSAGYGYTAVQTFTTLRPTLTVSPSSVSDMAGVQYQDGTPANVSVSGENMMGNVTVAVTSGFEVSTDGGSSWGSEKSITVAGATLTATTVKVRIASGSGTGAVTGTLTVSSSNAADVTVSLSGSVSGATVDTGSWLGDSYVVLNGDWYKGTATDDVNPAMPTPPTALSLGYLTTLTLGAQVQTYGQNDGETYPAYMTYSIDGGAETTVALVWFKYNNENNNNYFGMGGTGGQHVQTATELDLSGLASGEHTLRVYFSQPTSVGSGTLYDGGSATAVVYSITFVVPAWSGPNTVYWRNEAVDGHFVRQDGDGNHDPWWYQITDTVGFHNPNMTDHGPNCVIINNNNQRMMTNDVASTVESFSFIAGDGLTMAARTNWGTATLTVNSAITNTAAQLVFRMPVALGGNVKVYNTNATYFLGGLSGSGKTLTKTGAGTVYISSAATLGSLLVNNGHVQLNTGGSLNGDATVASSKSLRTNPGSGNTVNYGGVLSGAGYFLKQGAGTTTLSGDNTYSGKTSVTNGTLIAGHANALGTGPVYVGGSSAKLQVGVASVSVKSVNFSGANSALVTGRDKVLASTQSAIINKVTFDAGNYSGDDVQWAIVTSSSGTITLNGTLTVQNAPATGRCELELSADNKTLYVTYHKPPTAPALTVATVSGNGGALSVTATPPAGAGVVVVRNESGTFGSPTGSTLPSVGATEWAGGTVVSVTGGTFTDSGLTGCTTYYYKAWSLKNGLWSTTGGTDDAATDTVAAPVLNALSSVTYQGFTASWNAVPGAATYRMDIVKGSAETTAASYDFNENATGWTLTRAGRYDNAIRVGTGDYPGTAESPAINLSGSGGNATLEFDAWSYGSDTDCILDVWFTVSSSVDDDWVQVTDTLSIGSSSTHYSFPLTGGTETSQIMFTTDVKKKRVYVDNIVITQGGTSPVAGWTDKDVGSIMTESAGVVSVAVTGLEELTTYSVTVRAEGATAACASVDSNTESATMLENDTVTSVTIANYDAAGESAGSNVADGAVAAGQTALLQGTKLTVASGSVTPVLTGVTFATTGTATGSDAGTLRVRVGTSSTYAGTETALGTATYTGAGTYTVSGSQSLTAGTTYYVWIEAVTAAGAAGGSTVKVGSLTKDSFAITNGRKSGSTTAAGTQTIGNLTAFGASTGTTAGGQVALTWTAGASGTATVRWSDVSLEAIPAPGTAWANEATGLTGGSYTVTGLTGCKTYYFKAWEVVGGVACGTARTGTATASAPAAPTGLGHGTPTAHEATLSWTAGAGAATHKIDLWHVEGEGAVTGIAGTYTAITSTNDLTEGNYIIVAATDSGLVAMSNTIHSTPYIDLADVSNDKTATSLTVTTNDAAIVWKLAWDAGAGKWSMKNEAYNSGAGGYAASSGNGNNATINDSLTTAGQWTMTVSSGLWTLQNTAQSNRALKYNPTNPRFACYTSGQTSLKLFKQSGGSGTRVDDIIGGVVQEGSTVVATNGATSTGLGRLTDGTTYYWKVQAFGDGGCEGGVSAQDSFETAELLGVPTIVTPLTNGVERISGAVTGAAGATVILKRFESAELAGTGTAWGLSGTLVTVTEETPGSGTWTFADTGLEGCKTYWYKAWQWEDIDGERATSGASAVVSGKTQLGTPAVTATGAGTQMTLSWPAVPGASSYLVLVSSDDSFDGGAGTGDAVLTDDFEWITVKHDTSITNTLKTRGWASDFVYAGVWTNNGTAVKCARFGKSGAPGWIITPEIAAMANGGTLTFKLMKYSDDSGTVSVELSTDGSTWESLGYDAISPTTNWTEYTVALPASKTAGDSFFLSWETSSKRAYLDDISVAPNAGSGGTIVHTATLTSAPWETTAVNLEVGHTYYYRVTATNEGGCAETAEGSALTADAPIITVTPKHYNFGTVTKNSGEHTADFVVRNSGSVALKFNAVTLVQDGDAYSFVTPATDVARRADLAPGASRTYTVKFNPQNSGTRAATLRFGNDAYNTTGLVPPASGTPTYANTDIPLTGACFDPATANPDVLWLSVKDGLGVENTVWDESMAHSATQPVLSVIAYHYNGMYWHESYPTRATWTLYDAEGVAVPGFTDKGFTAMTPTNYDGKSCSLYTAPIPALGADKTYRGTYRVGVMLQDSTRTYTTTTNEVVPIEEEWLVDDFMRADAVGSGGGALGNSWVARASSGSTPSSAAIRNASLELYGPGGGRSGTAGRVAAGRDMSDERYPKQWKEFTGTGSWGFHFKTGAKTTGWSDGSTAGAFVLGATHAAWFTTEASQKGVAVMFTNDCVRLARFEKSLLQSGTITDLTTAAWTNGTQGKWLAVRVDYIPGQEAVDEDESDDGQAHDAVPAKMRLYVKEVAGPGGNPVEECGAADLVQLVEVGDAVDGNLKFGGPVWNHGTAQLSETTGGTFDDVYVPHLDGVPEPMEFRVIDEDVEGPEFYGFNIGGAIAAPDVASSGMTVTGMVHDASGLAGSVAFKVYNGETELYSGTATPAVVAGTTNMEYTVSCTIPSGEISGDIRSTDCRFEVTATDGDDDRSEGGTNIDATAGTASYPFTFCASTPTAPAWATAEADGAEMVVLRWARSAGTQYVVVRSDEEIGDNSSPQGRSGAGSMAEGTTVDGWGKVVYRGTGDNHLTGTWTAREFIVAPGSTNYFAVYGMTGDDSTGYYFSAPRKPNAYAWATTNEATGEVTHHTATNGSGVPQGSAVAEGGWPCATPKYEPGEGVDSFEYRASVPEIGDTNPQNLALPFNSEFDWPRPETGCGWGGQWEGDLGTWKIHDGGLLATNTHYPAPVGNKLYWEDTSSGSDASATLYRPLAAENTAGKFFVAGMMNYGGGLDASMFDTAGTWMTIALVDDHGDVLVSFGKQGGGTLKDATIQVPVGQFGVTGENAVECRNTGSGGYYTLNPGHGQDYIVAGEVDRDTKMIRMWVFYGGTGNTTGIPQVYDDPENKISDTVALEAVQASWSWAGTAPNWAGKIAGIKLIAGSDNSHQLGHVYFDEIRFAQTWQELFLFNDPEVYTYDFDKPSAGTGIMVGTDSDGHRLWQISDGALAHGNVGLNAQFGLYHRTGIQSASFTIKDDEGHQLLKNQQNDAGKTAPEAGGTPASVTLSGRTGAAYSDWKTPAGGATGAAVPTNWISLDSNYVVEVTLTSAGGRQAVVTAASESGGGGATDLFLGEFGEGSGDGEKYVEIYNGTGHEIDLSEYYIARSNPKGSSVYGDDKVENTWTNDYYRAKWYKWEKISTTSRSMPHKTTVVLLSNLASSDLKAALAAHCEVIQMTTDVVNSGGKSVIALFKADVIENADANGEWANSPTNKPWLDACGLSLADQHFIQSRLEDTKLLPRPAPDELDPAEWDYRPWRDDDSDTGYTNILATAGVYDRNIGLGGDMEFKVYDDDTDAPALSGGGVKVGTGSRVTGTAGDRTYVMGGWSFTNWPSRDGAATNNLTLEEYKWITQMWPYGMTTRGGVSWSPLLGGDDLAGYVNVIEAGNNKGESNAEFDGITQRKYGCMVAHASSSFAKSDEVWLGFDLDTSKLSEAVLTFAYAGGSAGFANARVEVSTTGQEGTFTHPTGWEFTANDTGGAQVWTEWSGALADAGEAVAAAGHLWFRVVLKDYGTTAGTFRMDNIRLEGAPQFLRVSDAQMNTLDVVFDAVVVDTNSGLDTATASFTCGVEGAGLAASRTLNDGGKSDSTFKWTKTGGFTKDKVQEWYEKSLEGKTQLRMSIADKDDDRPDDATTMTADFGTLDVYDDDDDPPTLEMATMKPRKDGTMAQWLLKEKTQTASETMDGLDVGDLGLNTTAGTTSKPRYALATNNDVRAYAMYQSGWQAGSKYWTATIKNTTSGAGTITKVKFWSKVGSVLAPTGFEVKSGTVTEGVTGATTSRGTKSLLTSGSAWVKEGAEGATGSPIKTWAQYELTFPTAIPLAAGEEIELQIFGTGADADGIGATWYVWGLEFEGALAVPGEGGEDGYTYVTDNSLTGGGSTTLTMSGNVWDESGLAAAPSYSLTNAATGAEISSGTVSFTSEGTPASRTTKALGEFSQNITLSSMGYGVQLTEYKGGIHAEDADHDREDASGNNTDKSSLDGQFAFTVIDQDLVGPSAPANVKVNGVDVPNAAPSRLTVTWTNKPEFLVSFDVAHDQVPTETQLTSAETEHATWRAANGITNGMVKKASSQKGAAGVGEYRVALAGAGGAAPTAAAMSNAPSFSVAVTNGALANYGFERGNKNSAAADTGWANPDGSSGIHKGDNVGGSYPVAEGTNSYYLREYKSDNGYPMASQVIPFAASESAQTVTVDLSLKIFKRGKDSIVYAKFEFSEDEATWTAATADTGLNTGSSGDAKETWYAKTMATKVLTAPAGAKYLRFSLYSNSGGANLDDVRLSVRVGAAPAAGAADRAMMRYVATGPDAQGLNAKYLFAADADNDRPQDRKIGAAVPFYTAYDITPPTEVHFPSHTHGADMSNDDPTTQLDLQWITSGVGPDDPDHPNYRSGWLGKEVLSPWHSYRVYYRTYDAEFVKTNAPGNDTDAYIFGNLVNSNEVPQYHDEELGWQHREFGDAIEDPTARTTSYTSINSVGQSSMRLYDLENDENYLLVIVGVDKAGNEGPTGAASWATNNTYRFSLIRGWHTNRADAVAEFRDMVTDIETRLANGTEKVSAIQWSAAGSKTNADGVYAGTVTKDYDLLKWDARSFQERPNNPWEKIVTVRTNWFVDDGGPTNRGSIRFYRASYKDRWRKAVAVTNNDGTVTTNSQLPLVSEEVYAQTAVPLRAKYNFVALHGVPYTNTFRGVFGGLDEFPGGPESNRTRITFYPLGGTEANDRDNQYWLNEDGNWCCNRVFTNDGTITTNTVDVSDKLLTDPEWFPDTNLFTRAFSIELPNEIPPNYVAGTNYIRHDGTNVWNEAVPYMMWKPILQVPTNRFSLTIPRGTKENPKFNIVALRLPVAAHPSAMNLTGMRSGQPWEADLIYTIDPLTREPGRACYYDGEVWRFAKGQGKVPAGFFKPNDVLVIVSRNDGDAWEWEYDPKDFYALPHRHMHATQP